jgi:MFS family permease
MAKGATPRLPRAVLALGVVSLLTDLSSEMIFPLLPVFLVGTLGAGALSLGLIEGVAESTASMVKLVSGALSDRLRRRKPLVFVGYGLAGAVRPLIGLARAWPLVLAVRFVDRIGKGLRGPPRDALIADSTPDQLRGRAYGVHRAMDHAGAVLGPLVAFGLLGLGLEMREVFFAAAVPATAVLLVIWLAVDEAPRAPVQRPALELAALGRLGRPFHRFLVAQVVFALGNATDAFLLLRLSGAGIEVEALALLWSLHHLVKMAAAYLGGRASDRGSRRALLSSAWIFYAVIYLGFAALSAPGLLIALFLAYGVALGVAEPVEKAWAADLVPPDRRGAAFGWMHGAVGLAALPASVLFGLIWWQIGPAVAFALAAGLATVAAAVVTGVGRRDRMSRASRSGADDHRP